MALPVFSLKKGTLEGIDAETGQFKRDSKRDQNQLNKHIFQRTSVMVIQLVKPTISHLEGTWRICAIIPIRRRPDSRSFESCLPPFNCHTQHIPSFTQGNNHTEPPTAQTYPSLRTHRSPETHQARLGQASSKTTYSAGSEPQRRCSGRATSRRRTSR